ncbi:hypothetical protein FVW20_15660 [Desulfovibrio oxamicus]|uniref:Uncharacterized protein n=1 Tax=Nitratidesulfovibrio oxamicus TaxID=32016 RepID=A0ABS0J7G1_9BACT|nr:hypothetical protein [Nitratidesulfovibrio oxamicus]MBG3878407.1 hypothetical protein [Nitratidesulfovibrio oxamicus]
MRALIRARAHARIHTGRLAFQIPWLDHDPTKSKFRAKDHAMRASPATHPPVPDLRQAENRTNRAQQSETRRRVVSKHRG